MGTDAIGMVEVQKDGRWSLITYPLWPNWNWKERGEQPLSVTPQLPRHYGLFSALADVRNRSGRGIKIMQKINVPGNEPIDWLYDTDDGGHDPLEFIDEPRGVPKDANGGWKAYCTAEGTHDPTWFTLAELMDGPWDQTFHERSVLFEEDYVKYLETGEEPEYRAAGVGGPDMRVVSEEEYAAGERGEKTAVDFHWKGRPLRQDIPEIWWALLGAMDMVAPDQDANRVRLLVCFDS